MVQEDICPAWWPVPSVDTTQAALTCSKAYQGSALTSPCSTSQAPGLATTPRTWSTRRGWRRLVPGWRGRPGTAISTRRWRREALTTRWPAAPVSSVPLTCICPRHTRCGFDSRPVNRGSSCSNIKVGPMIILRNTTDRVQSILTMYIILLHVHLYLKVPVEAALKVSRYVCAGRG